MDLIARLFLVSMFLYASFVNPFKAGPLKGLMKSKGMPFIDVLFPVSNMLMFCASLAIIFNFYVVVASFSLIIFMIFVTYYFADFWNVQGADRDMLLNQFTANITIIGGLLLLIVKES